MHKVKSASINNAQGRIVEAYRITVDIDPHFDNDLSPEVEAVMQRFRDDLETVLRSRRIYEQGVPWEWFL